MKTLLQINVTANFGSTGKIAEQIGAVAQSQGWHSVIAYGRRKGRSSSELYRIGNGMAIGWHLAQSRLLDRHGRASCNATRNLIQYIEKVSPDVIHLHNIHGYYLNFKMLFEYLAKRKTPVVWTLHDCWAFTGHCAYFDFVSCDKWESGCNNCPQIGSYPQSWIKDNSASNYSLKSQVFTSLPNLTLVPVSEWLSGLLSESFLKDVPRQTIHNGIDIERFSPTADVEGVRRKYGIGEKKVVLGVANIWEPRKGLLDFKTIRKQLPEEYLIVLVGLSEKQMKTMPDGILGIARTDSVEELVALYSAADVLLNPTYEDNFPTVNLEAMACGTPVVTYDTGGCSEAVNSQTGTVVKKGDLDGVLKAISEIIDNGKEHYSESCRMHIVTSFAKEDKFQEYIKLYNKLIE